MEGKQMNHITMEQWGEFDKLFPEARQWLIAAGNKSELAQLEYEDGRQFLMTEWQRNRLAELRRVKKFCDEVNGIA
jgi:hypothetical protein